MNKRINKLRLFLLDLPRDIKLIISLAVDIFLCITVIFNKNSQKINIL